VWIPIIPFVEKIELTGLRNNTWNMELNGPLAENQNPKVQSRRCVRNEKLNVRHG
jgi:hypothetical protein